MIPEEPVAVAIVGGGHAGLLLGAALARSGFSVRLVERQPAAAIETATSDGRNLALLAGSAAVVRRLGAWRPLAPLAEPIERVAVVDVGGSAGVRYDSLEHGTGPFGHGFEHVALRRGLLRSFLDHAGQEAMLCDEVAGLERIEGAARLRLASGRQLVARLVIGVDGRGSRVRELARIALDRWSYDQRALTMILRHDRPHRGTVREWLRSGGPLATLPLRGRRSGITWVERSGDAAALGELPRQELLATLSEITGAVLGRLEIESGPSAYPLGAQHARAYVAPRVALVGDAAHGVHPIHAQGFNMGVADVGALVDALVAARARRLDLGSGETLLPYERARRGENTQRLWLTDGLVRLFATDLAPLRLARGLALDAVERVPPLKRLAVRHGMQTG
ncbi:MAG: FAD-dependent monooxygenase [Geminicoccaceae bacterium]